MAGRGCSLHEEDFDVASPIEQNNNNGRATDLTRDEKRALGSWSGPASTKGASTGEATICCRCKEQPASVRTLKYSLFYMHACVFSWYQDGKEVDFVHACMHAHQHAHAYLHVVPP